jgi:hypothetical protein
MPWDPIFVNALHKVLLKEIDEEGFVRVELL